jgi:hypothetical protein
VSFFRNSSSNFFFRVVRGAKKGRTGRQAPLGPKAKNAKLCSGPGPMYPRDKLPKIPTRENIKSRIKAKRLKA